MLAGVVCRCRCHAVPPPKLLLIGSDDHTPVVVPRADYAFMFLSSFWYDSALLRTASIRVG
ncbi:Uncharacterised protein [Mycobacteroides abscessus subsp. abscessus]|nr:Uncharacterised protein [Mycobacteroides abscessus subsp. abscessus]